MVNGAAAATKQGSFLGLSPRLVVVCLLTALLFVGLGVAGYQWAKRDALATLQDYSGQPERDTADAVEQWFAASIGDEFGDGAGARTPASSTAQFQLLSRAKLTLKPSSQIRFQRRGEGKGAVGLTVEVGEVDVRTRSRTLTINSQFGEVVIDPNSLIRLKRNGKQLLMSVEVGGLELSREKQGSRRLGAGESLTVAIGGIIVSDPQEEETKEPRPKPVELDPGDAIDHFDLVVPAGQSFKVHDPKPPAAVGFRIDEICRAGGRAELGQLRAEAREQINLSIPAGNYHYEIRCLDSPGGVAAEGDVKVLRDAGTRTLPQFTPTAQVSTDGRRYTVMYQSRLPRVTVTWPGAPEAQSYTLQVDETAIPTTAPSYRLNSGKLGPGTHQLTFRADTSPPRQSRTTTVSVRYDAQAPAARVSEPRGKFEPGSSVAIRGRALPGWSVSLFGQELELDGRRRFSTEISTDGTLPIAFSHPKRGIHYYLRRPRRSSKDNSPSPSSDHSTQPLAEQK